MLIIVLIPETGQKAIWDTAQDRFFEDAGGDQAWDSVDDIDCSYMEKWDRLSFIEQVSLLWDKA